MSWFITIKLSESDKKYLEFIISHYDKLNNECWNYLCDKTHGYYSLDKNSDIYNQIINLILNNPDKLNKECWNTLCAYCDKNQNITNLIIQNKDKLDIDNWRSLSRSHNEIILKMIEERYSWI